MKKIKTLIKPFLNWRFLISYGCAYMITNGWAYIGLAIGILWKLPILETICGTYVAFLYLPMTMEKIVTIPLAIFFHTQLFKNDIKTKEQLDAMYKEIKTLYYKSIEFKPLGVRTGDLN